MQEQQPQPSDVPPSTPPANEEYLGQLEEAKISPDIEETPARGTFINVTTGQIMPFLSAGPDTDDWELLSPDPELSLEDACELVARGGYGNLTPDLVHL